MRILLTILLLACPRAMATEEASPAPARRDVVKPNVVVIVSDDMGWNDVGYHGSEIKTPNIDRLVAEGVELDRFYAFPICSPTRVALLTGRSPLRFGITAPLGGSQKGIPLDEHLLPQSFRAAGYQTFMAGKWHVGQTEPSYLPQRRGFDHFYGFLGGFVDYYKHSRARGGGVDWQRNGKSVTEEGYSTDLLADEAIRLVQKRDKSKPFLLYLSFNAAHTPYAAPKELIEKYKSIDNESRRVYAAVVDAMDMAIGRVLKTIDDEGIRKQTLVLYFNDNGGAGGRGGGSAPRRGGPSGRRRGGAGGGAASNKPLKGGKGTVQEGGIRVAAVMRWPDVLEAGRKSTQVMSVLDLLPTLTTAAGIETGNTKPLDGTDLWSAIRGGKEIEHPGFVMGNRRSAMIQRGPWKLVQGGGRGRRPGGRPGGDAEENTTRLFRIADDPAEEHDLAAENPELVRDLQARLEKLTKLLPENDGRGRRRRPRRRDGEGGGDRGRGEESPEDDRGTDGEGSRPGRSPL